MAAVPHETSATPTAATAAGAAAARQKGFSLSGRLLILTVIFVMLAEVLIYLPSVARFRISYLENRIELAHLASLALLAAPDSMVSEELEDELLAGVGARLVAMRRAETRSLILFDRNHEVPMIASVMDLGNWMWWEAIMDALDVLGGRAEPLIRVIGPAPGVRDTRMEIVLPTAPLVTALRDFSWRILGLSLAISIFTAGLVYLSLQWMLVRPMRRLTQSIVGFGAAPEDARQIIAPSGRRDELGLAERELHAMQRDLRQALTQRAHLAQLGIAVSKISHDLRNMLASAQLVSDRLAESDDPTVRHVAPRLVGSIDRAIALCAETLRFGKAEERPPQPRKISLYELAEDVAAAAGLSERAYIAWKNRVPEDLHLEADPEQLYRVLLNLVRNAAQAMAHTGEIRVNAAMVDSTCVIEVADTGAGLSENARLHLFEPFRGGARQGGTGLGLAIARELIRGHGGELELARTGPLGTTFRIVLPIPGR